MTKRLLVALLGLAAWAQTPPAMLLPDAKAHPEIPLWSGAVPGAMENGGAEKFRLEGDQIVLTNIQKPSITVFLPPAGRDTGLGVVVAPGGGFRDIWITHEGYRVAEWLAQRGIAAFVLKYRLERAEGSSYKTAVHSLGDIQRAVRLVRSRAAEFHVDAARVGVMGFSAGGALAGLAGTRYDERPLPATDAIDQLSAKPAFQGLIYGTPFGPDNGDRKLLGKATPPVFLLAGSVDNYAKNFPDVSKMLMEAGVSVELHLYAATGHGFGMRWSNPPAVAAWIERFREWLLELPRP